MDTLSSLRPPKDLLDQAGPFMPWLPPDATERDDATREVLAGLAEWICEDDVQTELADRIKLEHPGLLPQGPYDRREAVASIVAAIQYVIGVR